MVVVVVVVCLLTLRLRSLLSLPGPVSTGPSSQQFLLFRRHEGEWNCGVPRSQVSHSHWREPAIARVWPSHSTPLPLLTCYHWGPTVWQELHACHLLSPSLQWVSRKEQGYKAHLKPSGIHFCQTLKDCEQPVLRSLHQAVAWAVEWERLSPSYLTS